MPFLAAIPAAVTTVMSLGATAIGLAKGPPNAPSADILEGPPADPNMPAAPGIDMGPLGSFPMSAPPPPPQYQQDNLLDALGEMQGQ